MNFTISIQRFFNLIDFFLKEIDIVIAFFNRLIRKVTRESQQKRLKAIHAIYEKRVFKIKHLKTISNLIHLIYQRAIVLNILDDMTFDFVNNLRLFKQK